MNDIQQVNRELTSLENERDAIVISRLSSHGQKLTVEQLKYRILQLKSKLLQKLKSTHNELAELESIGLRLLQTKKTSIVVSKTGSYFFGHYTNRIQGRMHKNGFFYGGSDIPHRQMHKVVPTIKSSLFGHTLVPVSYSGYVNVLGTFNLQVNKLKTLKEYAECPKHIVLEIGSNGQISAKVDDYEKSGYAVYKVIFDPFAGDQVKRLNFLENKRQLEYMLHEIRQTLV